MAHQFSLRVYYEDTDLAGIVYYANYLKFIERGRSEAVRDVGVDQVALKATGLVFAVRRVEADYLLPAKFDDVLIVHTTLNKIGAASMEMLQEIQRDGQIIFSASIRIACINQDEKPARIPADIRLKLAQIGQ